MNKWIFAGAGFILGTAVGYVAPKAGKAIKEKFSKKNNNNAEQPAPEQPAPEKKDEDAGDK